ncbi:hypothetical protein DL96DRAFT_1709566 [Flagelloscypha sp. PMI_526]|nr:hypothetical protein DL96DRAFT_1709566 [Flagelloscypha sp. PMI_526]
MSTGHEPPNRSWDDCSELQNPIVSKALKALRSQDSPHDEAVRLAHARRILRRTTHWKLCVTQWYAKITQQFTLTIPHERFVEDSFCDVFLKTMLELETKDRSAHMVELSLRSALESICFQVGPATQSGLKRTGAPIESRKHKQRKSFSSTDIAHIPVPHPPLSYSPVASRAKPTLISRPQNNQFPSLPSFKKRVPKAIPQSNLPARTNLDMMDVDVHTSSNSLDTVFCSPPPSGTTSGTTTRVSCSTSPKAAHMVIDTTSIPKKGDARPCLREASEVTAIPRPTPVSIVVPGPLSPFSTTAIPAEKPKASTPTPGQNPVMRPVSMAPSLLTIKEADPIVKLPDPTSSIIQNYPVSSRPLPEGLKPGIWAVSRQEVCETVDWFRSYQSGVYFTHGVAKGYLLSGFPSQRDRYENNGKLIISHGGGKAASIHKRKARKSKLDVSTRPKATIPTGTPLALLIDNNYHHFPYHLGSSGITYAALGWYIIVAAWVVLEAETQSDAEGKVRYKFAFQWCESQGAPWWWIDEDKLSTVYNSILSVDAMAQQKCSQCKRDSPQVYIHDWACMNAGCPNFLRTARGMDLMAEQSDLEYRPGLLSLRSDLVEPKGGCPPLKPRKHPGMPYNYVGGADNTVSFEQAPAAEFNEVLSAAYMETQSMSWHCDSEHGLGPVVAGLSMGAPAVMNFREKKESKKKTLKIQEASVECSHEISLSPDAELIKEGVVASIVLQHGDILVMEGSGVQDHYEHCVIPKGGLRIAATARVIDPEKNAGRLGQRSKINKIKKEDTSNTAPVVPAEVSSMTSHVA